jgi:serine/threonine protein kinase
MLDENFDAKICDFGEAVDIKEKSSYTDDGDIDGSELLPEAGSNELEEKKAEPALVKDVLARRGSLTGTINYMAPEMYGTQ